MATEAQATAPAEFDWKDVGGRFVERLRDPKVIPVPAPIVRQAQRSLDGEADPKREGKLLHNMSHEFPNKEMAAAFAKHMKNAGAHTEPRSSVSVVIDEHDERIVKWKAGKRRGATPA